MKGQRHKAESHKVKPNPGPGPCQDCLQISEAPDAPLLTGTSPCPVESPLIFFTILAAGEFYTKLVTDKTPAPSSPRNTISQALVAI